MKPEVDGHQVFVDFERRVGGDVGVVEVVVAVLTLFEAVEVVFGRADLKNMRKTFSIYH